MVDKRRDDIESRQAEVAAWLASGLDIDIASPTADDPSYTATLSELNLTGTGSTEGEALDALMTRLSDVMTMHMLSGSPLPDRRKRLAAHPDRPPSTGNA
jgi:hypothetical protein